MVPSLNTRKTLLDVVLLERGVEGETIIMLELSRLIPEQIYIKTTGECEWSRISHYKPFGVCPFCALTKSSHMPHW